MFYGIDEYFIMLVLPAMVLAFVAQMMVKSAFSKYSKLQMDNGLTGKEAAERILQANGISYVRVEQIAGSLTDHFDPTANVIRLSSDVYSKSTVAAVGVAAHESGHAIQYATGYVPMKIRAAIIPATQFGSNIATPLFIAGMIFSFPLLMNIGILCFGLATLFQLVTLPVEFNASARAVEALDSYGIISRQEKTGVQKVLRAAALTYVAALIVSAANLLRLFMMSRRRN